MKTPQPFAIDQLTDRDLAILDHYVWGKDVPEVSMTAQLRATVAEETVALRRRVEIEIERRRQAPRTYRTESFKEFLSGADRDLNGSRSLRHAVNDCTVTENQGDENERRHANEHVRMADVSYRSFLPD